MDIEVAAAAAGGGIGAIGIGQKNQVLTMLAAGSDFCADRRRGGRTWPAMGRMPPVMPVAAVVVDVHPRLIGGHLIVVVTLAGAKEGAIAVVETVRMSLSSCRLDGSEVASSSPLIYRALIIHPLPSWATVVAIAADEGDGTPSSGAPAVHELSCTFSGIYAI
ncbi:hypothetical protein ACLOJK_039039 [Asimina triloba]